VLFTSRIRTTIPAIAVCVSACAGSPHYDSAFITLQTGYDGATQPAEIIGIIATAQVRSVFCLKPSLSNPPDANCPTNGAVDPSGNNFRWRSGTTVSGNTPLAFPLAAPLLVDPTENLTIVFQPGIGSSSAWSLQSVTLQLQDSTGLLSPATVVRVSAPWTGAKDCIAHFAEPPNATQVKFTWANMRSDDALTQSPGGVFVDGNRAGDNAACAPGSIRP
jgi:hypothetical protein